MKIVIIGGGASGLMCAVKIKYNMPQADVTILERMPQAGKKLLATGNGRCNLSNVNADNYGYYGDTSLAKSIINKYSVSQTLNFFKEIGLLTKTDDEGRIYPYSFQAVTVLEILKQFCNNYNVKIINDCTVNCVKKGFTIITSKGDFKCDKVVFACGGKSAKELGSDGSCYEILKTLGHKITPLSPAIVQLKSSSKYPRMLKGVRQKCEIGIEIDGITVDKRKGEVLFTDYGLSGICTMQLSRLVAHNIGKKIVAVIDLLPEIKANDLIEFMSKQPSAEKSLMGVLPLKLSEIIAKQGNFNIENMAAIVKNWRLIITDTLGYKFSQVTSGGVDTYEFDENLESKLIKNLYCCGEVLNVDGDCGGYNLQWCWSSAMAVADSICMKQRNKNDKN